jgi:rSAM/selenodomain-associated transferase 2
VKGPAVRISVIIPCLNDGGAIGDLLESLQLLRDKGHEVIVADGGSSDSSRDVARPLVDRLVTSGPGRARQMNAGAQSAGGELLWFLHADSRLPRGYLEAVVQSLEQGNQWGRFDIRLSGKHPMLRVVEFMMNWRSRLSAIATGDQGIFVRSDLFLTVGGYADISLMEDVEISRKLKRHAAPDCLPQAIETSSRRWEKNGIFRTIFQMWWLRLRYWLGAEPDKLARVYGQCSSPIQKS